jgi:hypothetical protein
MSETQFTPGPWCLDGFNMSSVIKCVTPKGHPDAKHLPGDYVNIARCEGGNWKADARLIAAAPELLLALEDLLAAYSKPDERLCCDGRDCGCMGSTIHQQAEHYARVAIEKARGEAHPSGGDRHGE